LLTTDWLVDENFSESQVVTAILREDVVVVETAQS